MEVHPPQKHNHGKYDNNRKVHSSDLMIIVRWFIKYTIDHLNFKGSVKHIQPHTVECRYNAVQYNIVLHTSLQEVRQNINQKLNPQKTGELWGVFRKYFVENWPRYNGTALYIAEKMQEVIEITNYILWQHIQTIKHIQYMCIYI